MRSWTYILGVALLAVLFLGDADASVTKVSKGSTAFYPTSLDLARANAPASANGLTNAERLRRKLPLKKPSFRRESDELRIRARASPTFSTSTSASSSEYSSATDSASTSASAAGSTSTSSASSTTESSVTSSSTTSTALPSPTVTCSLAGKPGVIQVSSNSVRTPFNGYVSNVPASNGDYLFTTDPALALVVTFSSALVDVSDSCTALNAISSNGVAAYPFFGVAKGYWSTDADLGVGSANYGYILGVSETSPLSTPQNYPNAFSQTSGITEAEESAIWVIDEATGKMTARWVNSDSSLPSTTLVFIPDAEVFALLGDVDAFEAISRLDVVAVTFTFVPL